MKSPLNYDKLIRDLQSQGVDAIQRSVPLSRCSYWRIGGPADLMIEPGSAEQVQTVLRHLRQSELPYTVIGDGCNLLFDDQGFSGVVVRIGRRMAQLEFNDARITAQGGVYVPSLARASANRGLSGLEHIIGIPGSLGGLVLMNGGSLRRGIGENIEWVEIVTADGDLQTLSQDQCDFSYRHSALQGTGAVVVRAGLVCEKADRHITRRTMLEILQQRRTNFPRLPSCGSVFLNAPDLYRDYGAPGKVIEETGLKGLRCGDIEVSPQHANFMVNHGGGTSAQVLTLIDTVRQKVFQRTGYWLNCEVRHIAADGTQRPAHLAAESYVAANPPVAVNGV